MAHMVLLNVMWSLYYLNLCSLVLTGTFCLYFQPIGYIIHIFYYTLIYANSNITIIVSHGSVLNRCPIFHNTVIFFIFLDGILRFLVILSC